MNQHGPNRPQPTYRTPGGDSFQPVPQPPVKPRWVRTIGILAGLSIGCLIVAALVSGALSAGRADGKAASVAASQVTAAPVTVTVTAPPKPAATVTVAPASCTAALAAADKVISTAGEGFGITSDALTAASQLDADGINAAAGKLAALNRDKLTPQLAAYRALRDAC